MYYFLYNREKVKIKKILEFTQLTKCTLCYFFKIVLCYLLIKNFIHNFVL